MHIDAARKSREGKKIKNSSFQDGTVYKKLGKARKVWRLATKMELEEP